MKKILFITIILLILTSKIQAQSLLFPPQVQITTFADTNYALPCVPIFISANNPRFENTRYIFGWQWDQGRTMTKNLMFNSIHTSYYVNTTCYHDNQCFSFLPLAKGEHKRDFLHCLVLKIVYTFLV